MTTRTGSLDDLLTLAGFSSLPEEEGWRLELSEGRVVREPAPGMRHGHLASRVAALLRRFGEDRGLGLTFVDTGFTLASDPPTVRVPDVAFVSTVRVPDVAFVSTDRVPGEGLTDGFGEGAPDLAVEVVSPSNSASGIQRKALQYMDAGARLVWVVDPAGATVTVYRTRSDIRILAGDEVLSGEDVLPDLQVPVSELFSGI
jgi:Uma2 family endonuclease